MPKRVRELMTARLEKAGVKLLIRYVAVTQANPVVQAKIPIRGLGNPLYLSLPLGPPSLQGGG